jgi:S-formylglutathione hydrolase FrmB
MAAIGAPTWLDGFGEWSWPGLKPAVELSPAAWVPALPRIAVEAPAGAVRVVAPRASTLPRPLRLARLVLLLAVAGATFVVSRSVLARPAPGETVALAPPQFADGLTSPFAASGGDVAAAPANVAGASTLTAAPTVALPPPPLPEPVAVSTDAAGSTIASITFYSVALGRSDRYLVYLPPHYRAASARRYPVLYLLHGDQQPAASFLRLGLQPTLDALIDSHAIRPMIAVMLQGAGAPADWRNTAAAGYYNYVVEVQSLTDRVLPTIPSRSARAIAGYSMGGFGAMNVALTQLRRYSVVESWEGDFANLQGELNGDRSLLKQLPLRAFVWGGAQDTVVPSSQNAPWAAAMRAAGADAQSAIYPGAHAFAPIERHLSAMLSFAGRALRS